MDFQSVNKGKTSNFAMNFRDDGFCSVQEHGFSARFNKGKMTDFAMNFLDDGSGFWIGSGRGIISLLDKGKTFSFAMTFLDDGIFSDQEEGITSLVCQGKNVLVAYWIINPVRRV